MDPISRLEASIAQTQGIVAATTSSQWADPAPACPDWDVKGLISHTIGALRMFGDVAASGSADMGVFGMDLAGDNPLAAYDAQAAATVAAWKADGKIDSDANMPWGAMPAAIALQILADDVLVHGWDLASATGQQIAWDQDLAADTLEFAQMAFQGPARAGSFGEPVDPPAGADAMTQLVCFLGRQP